MGAKADVIRTFGDLDWFWSIDLIFFFLILVGGSEASSEGIFRYNPRFHELNKILRTAGL